jgi:hypothetical protein
MLAKDERHVYIVRYHARAVVANSDFQTLLDGNAVMAAMCAIIIIIPRYWQQQLKRSSDGQTRVSVYRQLMACAIFIAPHQQQEGNCWWSRPFTFIEMKRKTGWPAAGRRVHRTATEI